MTIDDQLAALAAFESRQRAVSAAYGEARLAALPPSVLKRLQAVDREYAAQLDDVARQIAAATTVLKAAVLRHGHSVQGHGLHAVYCSGRVAWDDRALHGYAHGGHPEVLALRTVGAPTVSLRHVPEERG